MNASRCTHWLDLAGHTFDCDLNLGHHGNHVEPIRGLAGIDEFVIEVGA